MARLRSFVLSLVMVVAFLASAPAAMAQGKAVGANFLGDKIDLIPVLRVVESDSKLTQVEIPGGPGGALLQLTLEAQRDAGPYRWAVFTLTNPDLVARDFVLAAPRSKFVGSGIMWPKPIIDHIHAVKPTGGLTPKLLSVRGGQFYALTIGPGETNSFAIELTPALLESLTLWHRNAFSARVGQLSFFNGVIIGIAALFGIAVFSLFIARPLAVFPAAALLIWSIIGFLLLDAGFFSTLPANIATAQNELRARAMIEAAMLAGLAFTLLSLLQLSEKSKLLGGLFWTLGLVGVALIGFGFVKPLMASGIARMVFFAAALIGALIAVVLWRKRIKRARMSVLVWIIAGAWSLVAAYGVMEKADGEVIGPVINAGLILIPATLGFALAQLAFGRSIAARTFLEDSGRRALALAGSEQSVWDWQAQHKILFIGPELERALGLEPGSVAGTNLRRWLELIHPADRGAYVSAVEAAERRGRGAFSQDFRLRRHDGTYRWFLLRARAIIADDRSVARLIGTLTDVTGVKRAEDRLLADAVRDRVTGLPNRALFIDRLDRAMRRARARESDELFVLVIDLDRFKTVNDGLGHEIGDSLLNVIARRLSRMIGPDDTLGRLSGDQFGIIFNGQTPAKEIIAVADNVRQIVAMPINVRPREIFLTASIGVAQIEAGLDNPEDLIKNAEIALYEGRREGLDAVSFFGPEMRDDRSRLVALENDLRRALDRGEIEVLYQPIKRLADDQLAGFEALVRWRHHELGLLSPDAFISMAEETGIIREVGRYVLNEAARQLGIWQRAFRPNDPLFVAVNVSSAQLLDYELVADLRALLRREDIVPGTLKLELTETMVMQNPELSGKVLEHAAGLGVGIACDDFGTGYSALANLARLPFDTLKVDKAFLIDDGVDERATIIFDSITHLAHNLGLAVVAEGVETDEQQERLRQRGCDYAQGYLIGEPVASERVVKALGGVPYGEGPTGAGLSGLWDRLMGRDDNDETAVNADLPSDEERRAEAQSLAQAEDPLEPWSPVTADVYDPLSEGALAQEPEAPVDPIAVELPPSASELAEAPKKPRPLPIQFDRGQRAMQRAAAKSEPNEPDKVESNEKAEKPEKAKADTPKIGGAPLAPRRKQQNEKTETVDDQTVTEATAPSLGPEDATEPDHAPDATVVDQEPEPAPALKEYEKRENSTGDLGADVNDKRVEQTTKPDAAPNEMAIEKEPVKAPKHREAAKLDDTPKDSSADTGGKPDGVTQPMKQPAMPVVAPASPRHKASAPAINRPKNLIKSRRRTQSARSRRVRR